MSVHDDFTPTRSAAHEYSERSIQHSREFMSHPEAVAALGELAPRLIEILDHLYVPETHIDKDGTLVVELSESAGSRDVPVISAPSEAAIRVIRNAPYLPDEIQRETIHRQGEAILDNAGAGFVETLVDEISRFDSESRTTNFRFSKFGGLAIFMLTYAEDFAAQSAPIITLNMHGPDEAEANPYVLLHEGLHAADVITEPLIDLRRQGFYRHLLRYELRGYHVSAKVLELQDEYPDLFEQYNMPYAGVSLIKRIEDARSRHNDFLGVDKFEPNQAIDDDLRRHGISILGSHIAPDVRLGD